MKDMKLAYLLSSLFPYDRLICRDAGPACASEYGWPLIHVPSAVVDDYDAIIVDNRHHNTVEINALLSLIRQRKKVTFFLRVNDPFFFHCNDPWYQFCAASVHLPNTHFITPYQPTGILSHWLSSSPTTQFVYSPFTYNQSQEINSCHSRRKALLAVSGNQRRDLYPLRFFVQRASKYRFSGGLFRTVRLNHPGYPEKTNPSHSVIGVNYLNWLSAHRAAFTDSSIYRLEFLKYREIAYAGCAPVGDLPWSLFECHEQAFFHYRGLLDLLKVRKFVKDPSCTQQIANSYRRFLRMSRCQVLWRQRVLAAIADLL